MMHMHFPPSQSASSEDSFKSWEGEREGEKCTRLLLREPHLCLWVTGMDYGWHSSGNDSVIISCAVDLCPHRGCHILYSVFNSSKERHLKSAPYSLVADLAPSPEIVSIVRSIHNKLVMKAQKQIELDLLYKMNRLHVK